MVVFLYPLMGLVLGLIITVAFIVLSLKPATSTVANFDLFVVENAVLLVSNISDLFVLIFIGTFTSLFGFLSSVLGNYKVIIPISVIGLVFVFTAPRSQVVIKQFDKYVTEIWVPLYNDVLLPVLNLIRILLDIILPVWNFYVQLTKILVYTTFQSLEYCITTIDAGAVVDVLLAFIESVFTFFALFLSDLTQDFQLVPVYQSLANVTLPFTPWFHCFCRDLAFTWDAVVLYLNTPNFQNSGGPTGFLVLIPPSPDLLNAILNFIRTLLKLIVRLLQASLTIGPDGYDPFNCGPVNYLCDSFFSGACNSYVQCQVFREPTWVPTFDYLTGFVDHWTGTLDDIVFIIFQTFINAQPSQVPRFFNIFAGVIKWALLFIMGLLDFLFHLDLAFNPNVNYLKYVDIDYQFQVLRETPAAVVLAFGSFQVDELSYIGVGISEILLAVIGIIEFVLKFLVIFFQAVITSGINHNPMQHMADYLQNYDFTQNIELHLEAAAISFQRAISVINFDWGLAFQLLIQTVARGLNIIVMFLVNFSYFFQGNIIGYFEFYDLILTPAIYNWCDLLQRLGIALGNCIRTFDQYVSSFGLSNECILPVSAVQGQIYPPLLETCIIPDLDSHVNLFCVTGDLLQVVVQFIATWIQIALQFVSSLVHVIISPSVANGVNILRQLLDNLEIFLVPTIQNLEEVACSFLAIIGSFFGCRDNNGKYPLVNQGSETIAYTLKLFFLQFLNVTNLIVDGVPLTGEVIGLVLQCSLDPNAVPIFLQQPNGCEGETHIGSLYNPNGFGNVKVTTCNLNGLFEDLIAVLCRYIFLIWDYVVIWIPLLIVRLVDLVFCIGIPNGETQNQNTLNSFFDITTAIRCLICDIVRIIIAVLRMFIYLGSGDFTDFINIFVCFPPINQIFTLINTVIWFFTHLNDVIFHGADIGGQYRFYKRYLEYQCSPGEPPCSTDLGSTPNIISQAHLPCWIVNTFLFKRAVQTKAWISYQFRRTTFQSSCPRCKPGESDGYSRLPYDAQQLLQNDAFKWRMNNTKYNPTHPDSPCYIDYRILLKSQSAEVDTMDWLHGFKALVNFQACSISSNFTNLANRVFPFADKAPIPPDIMSNWFAVPEYVIKLFRLGILSLSFISARTSAGGADFMPSWAKFKELQGYYADEFPEADFALGLVSWFDTATISASMFLSGMNQLPRHPDLFGGETRKRQISEARQATNFTQLYKDFETHFYEGQKAENLTYEQRLEYHERAFQADDESFISFASPDLLLDPQVSVEEFHQTFARRQSLYDVQMNKSATDPRGFGDMIRYDMNLGFTVGHGLSLGNRGWHFFENTNNRLRDAHRDGLLFTRKVSRNQVREELLHGFNDSAEGVNQTKRSEFAEKQEFTFEELQMRRTEYTSYLVRSHSYALMNFTASSLVKISDILMKAFNNTFHPRYSVPHEFKTRDPIYQNSRSIRNMFMTIRAKMDQHLPGRRSEEEKKAYKRVTLDDVREQMQNAKRAYMKRSVMQPPGLKRTPTSMDMEAILVTDPYQVQIFKSSDNDSHAYQKIGRRDLVTSPMVEMINVGGLYYSHYSPGLERTGTAVPEIDLHTSLPEMDRKMYVRASPTSQVFYELIPDFDFFGTMFPLADLCFGPVTLKNHPGPSQELAPPYTSLSAGEVCFECDWLRRLVNEVVYGLYTLFNDMEYAIAHTDPVSVESPSARLIRLKPCIYGPLALFGTPCYSDCDCGGGGYCQAPTVGHCSIDGSSCQTAGACSDYQDLCVAGSCLRSPSMHCVTNTECGTYVQTCNGALQGTCQAPTPEPVAPACPAPFSTGLSIADSIGAIVWYIPALLIHAWSSDGDYVCWVDVTNWFDQFFTVWDGSDPNSIVFWINNIATCDWIIAAHCDTGPIIGFGILFGAIWTYAGLFLISLFLTLLGIPTDTLLLIWIWSPVLVLTTSYGYSPFCFPTIPICIADDIYWYLYQIKVDCIDWSGIFGNAVNGPVCSLSQDQCYDFVTRSYTPANNYGGSCPNGSVALGPHERYFPDCSAAPYNFTNFWKPIFFAIQWVWPSFLQFMKQTNSPTLRYFREDPTISSALDLETFPSGGPPKDELACFWISGGNTLAYLTFYGVIAVLLGFLFYLIWRIIQDLIFIFVLWCLITFVTIPMITAPPSEKEETEKRKEEAATRPRTAGRPSSKSRHGVISRSFAFATAAIDKAMSFHPERVINN